MYFFLTAFLKQSAHGNRAEQKFSIPIWVFHAIFTILIALIFSYCFTMNSEVPAKTTVP